MLWPILLAGFLTISSWADEAVVPEPGSLAAIPSAMLGDALSISIDATLSKPGEEPKWQVKDIKYTLPGSSVSIKLYGTDSVVIYTLTPHKKRKPDLLLVAQGQVWYKDKDSGVAYRTSVETLAINYGEKVFFYPFGVNPLEASPLRIEIVIEQYSVKETKNHESASAGTSQSAESSGTNP